MMSLVTKLRKRWILIELTFVLLATVLSVTACGTTGGSTPSSTAAQANSASSSITITGAGSTFDYPLFSKMFATYHQIHPNLPGIGSGLRLTGDLLARIYMGEITNWSDPAIAQLNPDLKLPNLPIAVVHRSNGSGTTYIFTA